MISGVASAFKGTAISASFVFSAEENPETFPVIPTYAFKISFPFSSVQFDVPLVNLSFATVTVPSGG